MKKTVFEIYWSLVCFVTVICCSVWLGMVLYSLVGVLKPEITLDKWSYEMYQIDQRPYQPLSAEPIMLGPSETIEIKKPKPFVPKSDKQMAEERLANYQLVLKSEIRKKTNKHYLNLLSQLLFGYRYSLFTGVLLGPGSCYFSILSVYCMLPLRPSWPGNRCSNVSIIRLRLKGCSAEESPGSIG